MLKGKMLKTKLIWKTPEAEKLLTYCARVSNPKNQDNEDISKLINFCIKHGHWSILEMANMCVEIKTSRAISAQILRHRSFNFQEFSQRYAPVQETVLYKGRSQDIKNRQNSNDNLSEEDQEWFENAQGRVSNLSKELYNMALEKGIAKESARFLMPMASETTMYMSGTLRSWVHYLQVRCGKETQLEHREIAESIKSIFIGEFYIIAKALGWV